MSMIEAVPSQRNVFVFGFRLTILRVFAEWLDDEGSRVDYVPTPGVAVGIADDDDEEPGSIITKEAFDRSVANGDEDPAFFRAPLLYLKGKWCPCVEGGRWPLHNDTGEFGTDEPVYLSSLRACAEIITHEFPLRSITELSVTPYKWIDALRGFVTIAGIERVQSAVDEALEYLNLFAESESVQSAELAPGRVFPEAVHEILDGFAEHQVSASTEWLVRNALTVITAVAVRPLDRQDDRIRTLLSGKWMDIIFPLAVGHFVHEKATPVALVYRAPANRHPFTAEVQVHMLDGSDPSVESAWLPADGLAHVSDEVDRALPDNVRAKVVGTISRLEHRDGSVSILVSNLDKSSEWSERAFVNDDGVAQIEDPAALWSHMLTYVFADKPA